MYTDLLDLLKGDIVIIGSDQYRVDSVSIISQSCALTRLKSNTFRLATRYDKIILYCREQSLFN